MNVRIEQITGEVRRRLFAKSESMLAGGLRQAGPARECEDLFDEA